MSKPTFRILTLGCKVNQYESEAIAEELLRRGFSAAEGNKADIYIINTCTVTGESDRKSGQTVRRAIKQNPDAIVIVCGCFSQVSPMRAAAIAGVDCVLGSGRKLLAADVAEELILKGKPSEPIINVGERPEEFGFEDARIDSFPRTRAYIKIEDGCNNRCSYCIIPTARGRVRSKKPCDVINEINRLTSGGCPEIVLTGIETDAYGLDLDSYRLPDLIEDISEKTEARRIRLGSLDPSLFTQSFVDRVCTSPIMLPHYHISMQSGCSETLRQMRRRVNAKGAHEALERIRAARADVQFSADIIVGFPGETDEHFAETLEFIRRERFLNIHVFQYSKRAGTEAAARKDQVPAEVKKSRSEVLIAEQARIHSEILCENIGKEFELLVETTEQGDDGRLLACGHTPSFIQMKATCREGTERGQLIRVRATSSDGAALIGEQF